MPYSKKEPILWSDLEDKTLQNTLSQFIIKTIRGCILSYLWLILLICGMIGWYFTDLSDTIKQIANNQIEIIKTQVRQTEEIKGIIKQIDKE